MDAAHVSACSFSAWFDNFSAVSFPSRILPLPPEFADFLIQDGIFLADDSTAMPRRHAPDPDAIDGVDYTSWSDCDSSSHGSSSTATQRHHLAASQFAGFRQQIDEAIRDLGGKVLPKLNWSAPKDAWWVMSSHTTACTTSDEVLLLMQSSDRIADDICHAYDSCKNDNGSSQLQQSSRTVSTSIQVLRPPLTMVLRQWQDLLPGREFRCFVLCNEIAGISQRDVTQRFDFLPAAKSTIQEAILRFHQHHVRNVFCLIDYTYDVYIDATYVVHLIDFNPIGGATAPLLFGSWAELGFDDVGLVTCHENSISQDQVQFRIVSEPVVPRSAIGGYGMPHDFVNES